MNIKITLILLSFSFFGFSQKLSKKINEGKITGFKSVEFVMSVDTEKEDTIYYIYCGFQNLEYSTITDIGSIFITRQDELSELIKDLKSTIDLMDTKPNYNITRKRYTLKLYDFSKTLYVESERKYTQLSKKNAILWLSWLESIDISKLD
jgi:hypothetical protein